MPDTPNQDLEKQLRDYAHGRRAAAGTPRMHPATRRLLQVEVRQQFGHSGASASPRGWQIIWPRFALGSAVMAALVAMFVVINRPEFAPPGDTFTLAKNEAAVAPAPAASSELKAMDVAGRKQAETEIATASLSESLSGATTERSDALKDKSATGYAASTAAAPSESRRASGGTLPPPATASPSPSSIPSGEAYFSSDSVPSGRGMAMGARSAGTGAVTPSAGSDWTLNNATTQRFLNTAAADLAKRTPQAVVLDEFVVEQAGNNLKIVDRDGSVYRGNIQVVTNAIEAFVHSDAQAPPTAAATPAPQSAFYRQAREEDASNQSSRVSAQNLAIQNLGPQSVNYAFEVVGTNRSLRQRVVFNGNWIQNVGAVNVQNTSNLTHRFQNQLNLPADAAESQQTLQNQFINGRVYLGNSRSGTELNALPALEQQR